jgi:hypothetical protein
MCRLGFECVASDFECAASHWNVVALRMCVRCVWFVPVERRGANEEGHTFRIGTQRIRKGHTGDVGSGTSAPAETT